MSASDFSRLTNRVPWVAAFFLALVVALAGCSSTTRGSASQASATPSGTKSEPVPTQAALDAAMLTLADMPTGYTKDTSSESSAASSSASPPPSTDNKQCSQTFGNGSSNTLDTRKAAVKADVQFAGSDLGSEIFEATGVFTATQTARNYIGAFSSAVAKCTTTWTETDKDGKSTYTLAPLSFPKSGDTTVAIQEKIKSESALGLSVVLDLVAVQTKNALVITAQSGIAAVDPTTLTSLVPTAVSRVDKAVASA